MTVSLLTSRPPNRDGVATITRIRPVTVGPSEVVVLKNRRGQHFVSFLPAISNDAATALRQEIRSWRINVHSDKTLDEIASFINPIVHGWCSYYGRFYKSWLHRSLRQINEYLIRWARRKYKRLRTSARRAWRWLRGVQHRAPELFAHWAFGSVA